LEGVSDKGGDEALEDEAIKRFLTKVKPLRPSVALILEKASPMDLYWVGSTYEVKMRGKEGTCNLHLTISRGHMKAWVRPQAMMPPSMHLA
jgi:hypothetical protein